MPIADSKVSRCVALLALLAAIVSPVQADQGQATLSALTFELIDLDPADSIKPAVEWTFESYSLQGFVFHDSMDVLSAYGNDPSQTLSISSPYANGTISGSGSSVGGLADPNLGHWGIRTTAESFSSFNLTASTRIVFTALGTGAMDVSGRYGASYADVSLSVGGGGFGSLDSASSIGTGSFARMLSVTLDAPSSGGLNDAYLSTGTVVYADDLRVAAVPEPSTYAILLFGLGLLWAADRLVRPANPRTAGTTRARRPTDSVFDAGDRTCADCRRLNERGPASIPRGG